jgi:hypothetical protein
MFEHEGSQVWEIMNVSEKNKKKSWKCKDLGLDGGFFCCKQAIDQKCGPLMDIEKFEKMLHLMKMDYRK